MSSRGKTKTTMAKLAREGRLRERRMEKAARKERRQDPLQPVAADNREFILPPDVDLPEIDGPPPIDRAAPVPRADAPEGEGEA